jgi:Xaa-Pro aminopeptidase
MHESNETARFSTDVYAHRLKSAAEATAAAGLAGLVITPGYDLRYLLGSRAQTLERLTALVIPAGSGGRGRSDRGMGTGEPTVIVPRLELAALKGSAVLELGLAVRDWVDGQNPYLLVAEALGGAAGSPCPPCTCCRWPTCSASSPSSPPTCCASFE